MNLGIEGRVALVTGASRGIGLGIAAALAAEGARVAVTARSAQRVKAAAAGMGGIGVAHNTGELDAIPQVFSRVEDQFGPVDILVSNTGGPPGGDPLGHGREEWLDAYRQLVLAPLAFVQAALPGMRSRGWGRVLVVGSSTVREPIPDLMLSNVHRTGLFAGLKTIARHVAADGVTVNMVLPGRIGTERLVQLSGSLEAAAKGIPAGRVGTVEEIAAVAAFLCSARASYVTGTALLVDGGMTRSV